MFTKLDLNEKFHSRVSISLCSSTMPIRSIKDDGGQQSASCDSHDVENPDAADELGMIFVDIPTAARSRRRHRVLPVADGSIWVMFLILGTISFAVGTIDAWYPVSFGTFVECGSIIMPASNATICKDNDDTDYRADLGLPASAGLLLALITSMILAELSCRSFLLIDEIRNRSTRHNGHLSLAVSRTMDLNIGLLLVLIVSTTIMLSLCSWKSLFYLLAVPVIVFIHLCWDGFGLEVLSRREKPYWTIGRTFALQYYYGYLDKVLPSLSKRIELYEEDQFKGRGGLAAKRLILLAPLSCYTPPKFRQDLIDLFESKNVEQVMDNCCGTEGRIYKNPIYVIWNGDKWFCFAMEGIAMLNNLHVMKSDRGMTDGQLHDEYSNFCNGLSDVLKSSEYAKCVELIRYDDDSTPVADIVLQRFKNFNHAEY